MDNLGSMSLKSMKGDSYFKKFGCLTQGIHFLHSFRGVFHHILSALLERVLLFGTRLSM